MNLPLTGRSGQPVQAVLTQQEFESLCSDLFRRARLPLDEACWQVSSCAVCDSATCMKQLCLLVLCWLQRLCKRVWSSLGRMLV